MTSSKNITASVNISYTLISRAKVKHVCVNTTDILLPDKKQCRTIETMKGLITECLYIVDKYTAETVKINSKTER